jgi:hypothetical protein
LKALYTGAAAVVDGPGPGRSDELAPLRAAGLLGKAEQAATTPTIAATAKVGNTRRTVPRPRLITCPSPGVVLTLAGPVRASAASAEARTGIQNDD